MLQTEKAQPLQLQASWKLQSAVTGKGSRRLRKLRGTPTRWPLTASQPMPLWQCLG